MRYKSLIAGIALAAAPLIALAGPNTANAATAAHAAGNPNPRNYVGPAIDMPAGPLITYCASGELQVQWDNGELGSSGVVMQWDASANKFKDPASGHTILCRKDSKSINGVTYFLYAAVLNGSESNDCVSSASKGGRGDLELHGCSTSDGYEYATEFNDGVNPPFIVFDQPNACVFASQEGVNVQDEGTSTKGLSCDSNAGGYAWGVAGG